MLTLLNVEQRFMAYYEKFVNDPEPTAEMHALKLAHTQRVALDAALIIAGEKIAEPLSSLGMMAAWLHDIGRFPQLREYGTFSDLKSVDHAQYSRRVIESEGILGELSPEAREKVLCAVELHNRKTLPDTLDAETALLAHLVRDADKLDIFTLLDEAIRTDYLKDHAEVYWELPYTAPPSQPVVDALLEGQPIDYAEIKSFCDFVFIQIGWINGGLHFPSTQCIARARDVIGTRERFLCELIPESKPVISACCQAARTFETARCGII